MGIRNIFPSGFLSKLSLIAYCIETEKRSILITLIFPFSYIVIFSHGFLRLVNTSLSKQISFSTDFSVSGTRKTNAKPLPVVVPKKD
jgi:hypothetical protein